MALFGFLWTFYVLTILMFYHIYGVEDRMTFVDVLKSKAPEVTLHAREDIVEQELAEVVALYLYSRGKITSGTAAGIAGVSRGEFLRLAGKEKIPMFEFTTEELENELKEI
jgi:predicted HTH domain antitoxin